MVPQRHYEIYRRKIKIRDKEFNKAIRYKAFNNNSLKFLTDERKEEMIVEQQRLIVAIRKEMDKNGAYPKLRKYRDNKMSILPCTVSDNAYIMVIFDKEVDETEYLLKVDTDRGLLYLEEKLNK